jgi:hypothetical protein
VLRVRGTDCFHAFHFVHGVVRPRDVQLSSWAVRSARSVETRPDSRSGRRGVIASPLRTEMG